MLSIRNRGRSSSADSDALAPLLTAANSHDISSMTIAASFATAEGQHIAKQQSPSPLHSTNYSKKTDGDVLVPINTADSSSTHGLPGRRASNTLQSSADLLPKMVRTILQTSAVICSLSLLLVSVAIFHTLTASYLWNVHALSAKASSVRMLNAKEYSSSSAPAFVEPPLKQAMRTYFDMPANQPLEPDRFGNGKQQSQEHLASELVRNARASVKVPTSNAGFNTSGAQPKEAGPRSQAAKSSSIKVEPPLSISAPAVPAVQAAQPPTKASTKLTMIYDPDYTLPPDFSWETYLKYYPDLVPAGVDNEQAARHHYETAGRHEGRVYKQLKVLLRYSTCGGLTNQHYSHIAGLTLGISLGARIIMPPALRRTSFAHYFSTDPAKNKVKWSAGPQDDLWDTAALKQYWQSKGVMIDPTPQTAVIPDMQSPEAAYATWLPQGFRPGQVVRMEGVFLRAHDMDHLIRTATNLVIDHATRSWDQDSPIVLDLPCTLFMFKTAPVQPLVREVAQSLRFAPQLHLLADHVITGMAKGMAAPYHFNGLHLRMEMDAKDWSQILGGPKKLLRLYLAACQKAAFSTKADLYLASGILTYDDSDGLQSKLKQLSAVARRVHYKEQYLSEVELDSLTSEQNALVDFLVLAKASKFVGISVSTFSFFLREYRAMNGMGVDTAVLIDGSAVGTERLFADAAVVVTNGARQKRARSERGTAG